MAKLSIWNSGRLANDYRYIDGTVFEYFEISGTAAFIHLYLGTYDDKGNPVLEATKIQDALFLENRDRIYDKQVVELRTIYQPVDSDFDLRQFGLFLSNDDIFLEFHTNGMVEQLGRKLMNGDVIELPHLRENYFLDNSPSANKYYVVTDSSRSSDGYSQTWHSHVWRVKCEPITNSQEYNAIMSEKIEDRFGLQNPDDDTTLGDILSNLGKIEDINNEVAEKAKEHVKARNFDTQAFYVIPEDERTGQNAWIFAGDGVPPNGAVLTSSGNTFPDNPNEGDYVLRLDYQLPVLFKRIGKKWMRTEIDYRGSDWGIMERVFERFINNDKETTLQDGTVRKQKQALSKAVTLPKSDF